jgi:hypothetical protein
MTCNGCDGYGWVKDPANRHGAEIKCRVCHGSGHEDEVQGTTGYQKTRQLKSNQSAAAWSACNENWNRKHGLSR